MRGRRGLRGGLGGGPERSGHGTLQKSAAIYRIEPGRFSFGGGADNNYTTATRGVEIYALFLLIAIGCAATSLWPPTAYLISTQPILDGSRHIHRAHSGMMVRGLEEENVYVGWF